jgi:F-type H+-transporting ATPase subunit epsilon
MTDKLSFHLVSPEREVFSGEVDGVVVPGSEGDFGVLPKHAPVMSAIRPGAIRVTDGGQERRIFVVGGFADVTPDGLTILAEETIELADIEPSQLESDMKNAREDVADAKTDDAREAAQAKLTRLEEIKAAKEAP